MGVETLIGTSADVIRPRPHLTQRRPTGYCIAGECPGHSRSSLSRRHPAGLGAEVQKAGVSRPRAGHRRSPAASAAIPGQPPDDLRRRLWRSGWSRRSGRRWPRTGPERRSRAGCRCARLGRSGWSLSGLRPAVWSSHSVHGSVMASPPVRRPMSCLPQDATAGCRRWPVSSRGILKRSLRVWTDRDRAALQGADARHRARRPGLATSSVTSGSSELRALPAPRRWRIGASGARAVGRAHAAGLCV
jgi:hypothetical protein